MSVRPVESGVKTLYNRHSSGSLYYQYCPSIVDRHCITDTAQAHFTINTVQYSLNIAAVRIVVLIDNEVFAWCVCVGMCQWPPRLCANPINGLFIHHIHPPNCRCARPWINTYSNNAWYILEATPHTVGGLRLAGCLHVYSRYKKNPFPKLEKHIQYGSTMSNTRLAE